MVKHALVSLVIVCGCLQVYAGQKPAQSASQAFEEQRTALLAAQRVDFGLRRDRYRIGNAQVECNRAGFFQQIQLNANQVNCR